MTGVITKGNVDVLLIYREDDGVKNTLFIHPDDVEWARENIGVKVEYYLREKDGINYAQITYLHEKSFPVEDNVMMDYSLEQLIAIKQILENFYYGPDLKEKETRKYYKNLLDMLVDDTDMAIQKKSAESWPSVNTTHYHTTRLSEEAKRVTAKYFTKPEPVYTEKEVEKLLHDVLCLGMAVRYDQLHGKESRSGNQVFNEWWIINKK